MTDTVWVLTHGEYSDYGISYVFSTREAAFAVYDRYMAGLERVGGSMWPGYNEPFEWTLHHQAPTMIGLYHTQWSRHSYTISEAELWTTFELTEHTDTDLDRLRIFEYDRNPGEVTISMTSTDRERSVKAVADARARWIYDHGSFEEWKASLTERIVP